MWAFRLPPNKCSPNNLPIRFGNIPASEMTYIVSSGALNSTHSLREHHPLMTLWRLAPTPLFHFAPIVSRHSHWKGRMCRCRSTWLWRPIASSCTTTSSKSSVSRWLGACQRNTLSTCTRHLWRWLRQTRRLDVSGLTKCASTNTSTNSAWSTSSTQTPGTWQSIHDDPKN